MMILSSEFGSMDKFISAMLAFELNPPTDIIPGKVHRFPGADKGQSNKAGWCYFFPDSKGGVFGDWATGLHQTWRDVDVQTTSDRKWKAKNRATQKAATKALQIAQAKAAEKALYIWNKSTPALKHQYLSDKNIQAQGTRTDRYGNLVIPVTNDKYITSLQFIHSDGTKHFLKDGRTKGCWYRIGGPAKTLLLCEGFATGATLREESGYSVYCAFNAGNLIEVAGNLHHQGEVIICGDNDHNTKGNPGKAAAKRAAKLVGCKWVIPDFTDLHAGPKDSDFNDLARLVSRKELL
jgi:putative DNA primase/helicase